MGNLILAKNYNYCMESNFDRLYLKIYPYEDNENELHLLRNIKSLPFISLLMVFFEIFFQFLQLRDPAFLLIFVLA